MRKLITTFRLLFLFALACTVAISSASASDMKKKLWLADIDNGLIWIVDLDKQAILTSFESPAQEGSARFPIGMALLRGRLYVNNFNFNFCDNGNEMFSINKETGEVFSSTYAEACAIDGMAALPEAGLLLGIDSRTEPEQLLFFQPIHNVSNFSMKKVGAIDIDVPGSAVRGLAYNKGKLFIATETGEFPAVQSNIYIYQLNLNEISVSGQGSINLGPGFASPGLATYGDNLIVYRMETRELLVVEAMPGGSILDTISLEYTPIGALGALETKLAPDVYDNSIE